MHEATLDLYRAHFSTKKVIIIQLSTVYLYIENRPLLFMLQSLIFNLFRMTIFFLRTICRSFRYFYSFWFKFYIVNGTSDKDLLVLFGALCQVFHVGACDWKQSVVIIVT